LSADFVTSDRSSFYGLTLNHNFLELLHRPAEMHMDMLKALWLDERH
jgi:hypothetical protein